MNTTETMQNISQTKSESGLPADLEVPLLIHMHINKLLAIQIMEIRQKINALVSVAQHSFAFGMGASVVAYQEASPLWMAAGTVLFLSTYCCVRKITLDGRKQVEIEELQQAGLNAARSLLNEAMADNIQLQHQLAERGIDYQNV